MHLARRILTFSLISAVVSVQGATVSSPDAQRGHTKKTSVKLPQIPAEVLYINELTGHEEDLNNVSSPSSSSSTRIDPKWIPFFTPDSQAGWLNFSSYSDYQPNFSALPNNPQHTPSFKDPQHNAPNLGIFQKKLSFLFPNLVEGGQLAIENDAPRILPFSDHVDRSIPEKFAEERQFQTGLEEDSFDILTFSQFFDQPPQGNFAERQFRPPRRPLRGQRRPQRPQNPRGPRFPQSGPRPLSLPPPRPTPPSIRNPSLQTSHPDISVIPLQTVGEPGSNNLLEERFPPYNDVPVPSGQFRSGKQEEVPQVQLSIQDDPQPLSHQVPPRLTQEVPRSQHLEELLRLTSRTPRLPLSNEQQFPQNSFQDEPRPLPPQVQPNFAQQNPRPQPFTGPNPQPLQGIGSLPLQPLTENLTSPPQRLVTSSPLEEVPGPQFPFVNPSQPPVVFPQAQGPLQDNSRPGFERFPPLLPPPPQRHPPQELNHISQEPFVPETKPAAPETTQNRPDLFLQPPIQEGFRARPQSSPTPQPQNQQFVPSTFPPSAAPPNSGGSTQQPFPFDFSVPNRSQRGQRNQRPPPPRGVRHPTSSVRIRNGRRPRQFTPPPITRNTASRGPRTRSEVDLNSGSRPQTGFSSPFSSGENVTSSVVNDDVKSDPEPQYSADPTNVVHVAVPFASRPRGSRRNRQRARGRRAKKPKQTLSKALSNYSKGFKSGVTTVGQFAGRAFGQGAAAIIEAVRHVKDYATAPPKPPSKHTLASGFHLTVPNNTHITKHKFGLHFSMSSSPPGVPPMPFVDVVYDSDVSSRTHKKKKARPFLKPYVKVSSVPIQLPEGPEYNNPNFPRYKHPIVPLQPMSVYDTNSNVDFGPGNIYHGPQIQDGNFGKPLGDDAHFVQPFEGPQLIPNFPIYKHPIVPLQPMSVYDTNSNVDQPFEGPQLIPNLPIYKHPIVPLQPMSVYDTNSNVDSGQGNIYHGPQIQDGNFGKPLGDDAHFVKPFEDYYDDVLDDDYSGYTHYRSIDDGSASLSGVEDDFHDPNRPTGQPFEEFNPYYEEDYFHNNSPNVKGVVDYIRESVHDKVVKDPEISLLPESQTRDRGQRDYEISSLFHESLPRDKGKRNPETSSFSRESSSRDMAQKLLCRTKRQAPSFDSIDRSHFIRGPQPRIPCDPPDYPDNIQEIKDILRDPNYPADYYRESFRPNRFAEGVS